MNQGQKKVLYLITKATWGGAQRYVYDLATHLPKERFEPIVAYGTPGKLADDLASAGIATRWLPSLERDIAIVSDIKSFFEIRRVIRDTQPDVVHLNSSKAAGLGALAARIARIPKIVFTVHGWPSREPRNLLWRIIVWKISWATALLSHVVICVSEHDLRAARRMPFVGRKAVRVYNGIGHLQLSPADSIRQSFPKGAQITGTIGELNTNKNHIALIEEAKRKPDMHVAIVGEGEQRAYLERKIEEYGLEERMKLFGFLPAESVLGSFDVFVLPSLKEGLPYALLEAKAAGIPIVANRVGGVGEILDAKDMCEFSLENMVKRTIALYR